VAERDLEIEVMKEVAAKMVSVPGRRSRWRMAGCLLSRRRACTLFSVARSTLKCRSRKAKNRGRVHP
jgi:hypothetical protein